MAKMRAVVVEAPGDPSVLKIREREIPTPGPGQLRIKVAYCALNPLDTHSRAARVKWNAPTMPYTPGYEFAGLVDAVGDGVDPSWRGRRVASIGQWGGNADYAVVTPARLREVPRDFDWKLAACYGTTGPTAWHMVHSVARVKSGDTVVVHSAAGSVGALTAQIARDCGATVIGLVGSAERARYAKSAGCHHAIDRRAVNWADEVLRLTNGKGGQAIFDGVGGSDAALNYKAIAPLGNVVYLGQMGGPIPDVNVSMLIGKSFSVTGFVQYFHQDATNYAEEKDLIANLKSGRWRLPIERIEPLDKVAEMHDLFEKRQLLGRTLFKVGGDL
ncbi:MAG: zinc-binding dehydrogenase [Alphaproteobacteria bacterium]|nr:zinc-binding dehydrogenase [Alphaproteobacteria bacterium]